MLAVPSASALLQVWEDGESEHAIDRALTILAAFCDEPRESLAELGVHRRDALLVESRILAFGSQFTGIATCAVCGCETELELELAGPRAPLDDGGTIEIEGRALSFRVPNSFDLAAVAACGEFADGERLLQSRCVEGAGALDQAALAAADEAIGALCAPATIEVATTCPGCDAVLAPPVDMATIVWNEIATYARRLLDDVDALAARYGWSERDVLALPEQRRRRYIEGAW